MWTGAGNPLKEIPTTADAMAPMMSCPSAPMLKRPLLKANRNARAVNVMGVAFASVCPMAYMLPKAPLYMAEYAWIGE